jgi:hypothetical protein
MEAVHPNYVIVPSIADQTTGQGWDLKRPTNTKLLIHSNTTDGSTTFVDSVGTHSPTVGAADVEHDTAQKKWGKSSILFDGDSGYITIPDHADWYMATGKFAIAFWVMFNSIEYSQELFVQVEFGGFKAVYFAWNAVGSNDLRFVVYDSSTSPSINIIGAWTPTINTWYHIAVIRGWGGGANDWAITVNGSAITTASDADDWPNLSAAFTIGGFSTTDNFFGGWMDEFIVIKGSTPWESNFILPYGPYS